MFKGPVPGGGDGGPPYKDNEEPGGCRDTHVRETRGPPRGRQSLLRPRPFLRAPPEPQAAPAPRAIVPSARRGAVARRGGPAVRREPGKLVGASPREFESPPRHLL